MKQPHIDEQTQVADLPVSALLQIERRSRYGCVPGLPDEELADPFELERQVYLAELGPVLLLPNRSAADHLRPAIGEDGRPDWGAFGTVDFERVHPSFDGARYRAQQLREQVRDLVIRARVPATASVIHRSGGCSSS